MRCRPRARAYLPAAACAAWVFSILTLGLAGCGVDGAHSDAAHGETAPPAMVKPPAEPSARQERESAALGALGASGDELPAQASTCPAEMVLVEGSYCLSPEQRCVEPPDGPNGGKNGANHCIRYAEPSTCFDDRRRPMRFCMDRYEWPNQEGALPMVLVSWEDARQICASVDKRLCTEDEFNFACEGEAMRPYVYGFARDTTKCNFDKPYRERTFTFLSWGFCLADLDCSEAFRAIDQRMPSGSMEGCRSDHGVYDLNGNANEWVMLPGNRAPHRSGIKGGWWGPVRNRCRPTVTFHDEGDFGYEVGFRCCADTKG